ncbi:uncharacterized protein LOC131260067 [Anopheles coustani]|uniref:uncharacterized protein LOC131260067 n=1 Tax=Anopheles coustani TaxID=139045 RepID=UPI002659218C|nr:uncharacterized protein LOC131260067 [Anopheles coustani]
MTTQHRLISLLVVFYIFQAVPVASSLSCFSCNHDEGDDVCEESLIECDASSASVDMLRVLAFKPTVQMIQTSDFRCFELIVEETGDRRYRIRGCSYDSMDVCQGETRIGVQAGCRWCNDRDGCNSAGSLRVSLLVLGGLLVAGFTKQLM